MKYSKTHYDTMIIYSNIAKYKYINQKEIIK